MSNYIAKNNKTLQKNESKIEMIKEVSIFMSSIISLIGLFIKLGSVKQIQDNVSTLLRVYF